MNSENIALILKLLVSIFFAILFLQSGLDKIFNHKSELDWTKKHFEKSILSSGVTIMFYVLTFTELSAGLLNALGCVYLITTGALTIPFYGCLLASLNFIFLFFGQRVSKDYVGAQSLVSYFILSLLGIYLYI